jgi:hypothetical protein
MPRGQHLRNYNGRLCVEEVPYVSVTSLRTLRSSEFKTFFEDEDWLSFGESELKLYQGVFGRLVDVLQLRYFRLRRRDPVIRFYRYNSFLATVFLFRSERGYFFGRCGQCEKGVRNLFILPSGFLCFKCSDLIYTSSKASAKLSAYETQIGKRICQDGNSVHRSLLTLRKNTRKERFKIYQQESEVELKEII